MMNPGDTCYVVHHTVLVDSATYVDTYRGGHLASINGNPSQFFTAVHATEADAVRAAIFNAENAKDWLTIRLAKLTAEATR